MQVLQCDGVYRCVCVCVCGARACVCVAVVRIDYVLSVNNDIIIIIIYRLKRVRIMLIGCIANDKTKQVIF